MLLFDCLRYISSAAFSCGRSPSQKSFLLFLEVSGCAHQFFLSRRLKCLRCCIRFSKGVVPRAKRICQLCGTPLLKLRRASRSLFWLSPSHPLFFPLQCQACNWHLSPLSRFQTEEGRLTSPLLFIRGPMVSHRFPPLREFFPFILSVYLCLIAHHAFSSVRASPSLLLPSFAVSFSLIEFLLLID